MRPEMLLKILKLPLHLLFLLIAAWGTGALYYSEIPFAALRIALAAAFALYSIYAFWLSRPGRRKIARILWALLFVALAGYWTTITPSHDRDWRADMARMPRAFIDGDTVRFTNFRDFDYRGPRDFIPRYEEREVQISHLVAADFFVSYWTPGPVAHTFVSFDFDNAPPVCISIEARYEKNEGFDPLASLFKQFELIYVVGDERDLVRVRTNYRHEDVYMYRLAIPPAIAKRLFMVYLERINSLADHPEFYHLLSNSCTINIARYANRIGRDGGLDPRLILNGLSDRYLYRTRLIDTSLPFALARARAYINPVAQQTDGAPDFSEKIRQTGDPASPR